MEQKLFSEFPFISEIKSRREQLGFNEIDIELLKAQAGSRDVQLATQAQRLLRLKWDLEPSKEALQARTVDINRELSIFSDRELDVILKNTIALQLTEGCNGNCPFCVFGKKDGATAKFSCDSLEVFFQQNSRVLSKHGFLFYWDSDPFDYKDGDHSFKDVFNLYRKIVSPDNYHYVSTAIPRGSEKDFEDFMLDIASNKDLAKPTPYGFLVQVRLSLAQHNIQRVEATMVELTKAMLDRGFTQEEINHFYGDILSTVDRSDSNLLLPIGPYIRRADNIRDTYTTLCRDGVVISPDFCAAVMITTPTIYEPMGQKRIPLVPGQAEQQVPLKIREEYYSTFRFGENSLKVRTKRRQMMLEPIKHPDGKDYHLDGEEENMVLMLGREVASASRLISDFSKLAWVGGIRSSNNAEKSNYLRVAADVFKERKPYIEQLLSQADKLCNINFLPEEETEKLQYYILLTRVYTSEMQFLVDQVEEGQTIDMISIMANILREVGREQVDKLPLIFGELTRLGNLNDVDLRKISRSVLRSLIRGKFSETDKLNGSNLEEITEWITDFIAPES